MKKYILFILFFPAVLLSCTKEKVVVPAENDQTVFMYLPWSSNLTSYFRQNIADFETAIAGGILKNERVVVFFMTSPTEASLFELKHRGGKSVRSTFKTYSFEASNPAPYTTAAGITSILEDVIHYAPANRYAMVIGCHGMGWLPVSSVSRGAAEKYHWEYADGPLTRFFGGTTSQYQTDIATLADGIAGAGLKMEYILFDDCYMSSIEAAYDLREVTDYLIGCPTEVMAYGFPYHVIAKYMVGTVDYAGIAEGFLSFYENYTTPCGTIGITYCPELDDLAAVMKEINTREGIDADTEFTESFRSGIQRLDGYSPVVFYDLGDYVENICTDQTLLTRFRAQLARTVPPAWSLHTEKYYTSITSARQIAINAYSGVTTSDPSNHPWTRAKSETAWYKATH